MKLLFSESKSDYKNYIFPYAIWALREKGEMPNEIFERGFLPSSSMDLERFYLCRQVRVPLLEFFPSSENRRILKKFQNLCVSLISRDEFDYNEGVRAFCKNFSDLKFGIDVMSTERLNKLFFSPLVSHILVCTDIQSKKIVGYATLYLEDKKMAYYYYAFYDLDFSKSNLGMFMMTAAVEIFAKQNLKHVYLGSCYTRNSLYKTQFSGTEFFNGFTWSDNMKELKYLIERDKIEEDCHLLESEDYLDQFYKGFSLQDLPSESPNG